MGRIRVAVNGGNILTDDPKDLAFDSDQECMVIVNERIDTFTEIDGDGGHIDTFAHGLDYRPTVKFYEEQSAGVWSKSLGLLNAWADATYINFHLYDGYGDPQSHRIKTLIVANSQNGVVAGSLSNANGRVQVAKSGYDLNNITDLRQVAFSSKKGVMLMNEKRTITVSHDGTPDTTATQTYAHGLPYIPQFDAVLEEYGIVVPYVAYQAAGISTFFDVTVDATNITCSVTDVGGSIGGPYDFPFRVHISCGKIE